MSVTPDRDVRLHGAGSLLQSSAEGHQGVLWSQLGTRQGTITPCFSKQGLIQELMLAVPGSSYSVCVQLCSLARTQSTCQTIEADSVRIHFGGLSSVLGLSLCET